VTAFHMLQDPISEENSTPAWGKGTKTGTASLAIAYALNAKRGNRDDGESETFIPSESAVRRLTPRECERLQGFADDWTALGPDSRRYAALGDAVTVPVAEWIGRRLAA
jgi:site-specific DNA-cytosine methylase